MEGNSWETAKKDPEKKFMYQREKQTWNDAARQAYQHTRFDALVKTIGEGNAFYQEKWSGIPRNRLNYDHLSDLPFTLKGELLADQREHPPFGSNLSFEPVRYSRLHQTSGTTGTPLRVLDTPSDWEWWAECWHYVLDAAGVTREDVVMLAFSFGPFIGFWGAFEAVTRLGALTITGGGLNSEQRLSVMQELGATVLLSTPSYAVHLGETAMAKGMAPATELTIRTTIHAGEPGAGIPTTRDRIETLWGATAFDHPGASEVGAFGFSCSARKGVHVNEAEFICEVIDAETGNPAEPGASGELVLTNLGRLGFPIVRYRTHDVVKPMERHTCDCGRTSLVLEGGILGRSDDMVTVRGVNVFPSAFQEIFDGLPGVIEHRIAAYRQDHMDQLHVEFECEEGADRTELVAQAIRKSLGIRVSLQQFPPETLPRYELKAKRFFDRRSVDWEPGMDL